MYTKVCSTMFADKINAKSLLDKAHRMIAKNLRYKTSLFLKREYLQCYGCNKAVRFLQIKKLKLCSGCKMAYFCGKQCQKKGMECITSFRM